MKICCPNCNHEFLQVQEHRKINIVQTLVIINYCANHFEITYADIVGKSRLSRIVQARHCAIWLLLKWGGLSLVEIGRLMGRHHTSIMHGQDRVNASFFTKKDVYEHIIKLDQIMEEYLNPSKQLKATA